MSSREELKIIIMREALTVKKLAAMLQENGYNGMYLCIHGDTFLQAMEMDSNS